MQKTRREEIDFRILFFAAAKSKIRLASQEEMVYSCLDLQPKNIEEIFQEISLEPGRIAEILLKLELEGLIIEPLKNYYARMGG